MNEWMNEKIVLKKPSAASQQKAGCSFDLQYQIVTFILNN